MRIRSIKPEFWTSRTVSSVSWDARLVLKGLESYVDDNGAGRWDIELIVSEVFPRDHFRNPPETVARVSEAISELLQAGLLWKYEAEDTSRGGRSVEALYISNWEDLQRIDKPNRGRIRRPDGTLEYRDSTIRESSGNLPEVLANVPEKVAPVTEEQGNRGTEEQGNSNPPTPQRGKESDPYPSSNKLPKDNGRYEYPPEFDTFYAAYPHARDAGNKIGSYRSWRTAVKSGTSPDLILAGAEHYASDPNRVDQFTKACTTWLNKQGWLDGPLPARTDVDRGLAAAQRDMARYGQQTEGSHLQVAADPYPWETKEIGS